MGDTLIENILWANIGHNLQRSDSDRIFNYFNCYLFCSDVDFSINSDTVYEYGKYRRRVIRNIWITSEYHHFIYIEGIGQIKWEYWGNNNNHESETLITCRINGIDYGDLTLLDVDEEQHFLTPDNFELSQNHPNPFNPTTKISYELPRDTNVELIIYNTLGKEIIKLVYKNQAIGRYNINWNGQNSHGEQVPGGVYFYTLRTKNFTKTHKMLLLR